MGASAYVGRVGGLAVALGVGAAVATGHGVAWATTEADANSSTSEHSVSEGSPNADTPASAPAADPATAGGEENAADDDEDTLDEDALDEETLAEDAEEDLAGAGEHTDDTGEGPTDQSAGTGDEGGAPEGVPSEEPAPADEDPADEDPVDEDPVDGDTHDAESARISDDHLRTVTSDIDPITDADVVDAALTDADEDRGFRLATLTVEPAAEQPRAFMTTVQDVSPVALSAQEAPAAQPLLQRIAVNLLSSLGFGLNALASSLPGAPVWSPFVMAVLGLGSRREFTEPVSALARTTATIPVAALTVADLATAAVFPGTTRRPVWVSRNTQAIEYLTGARNLNDTTTRFGIGGTDLGIMWDNGIADNPVTTAVDEHQVLIAFGDTFSIAPRSGVWRFNTLFRTPDDTLANGLYVPNGVPTSAQTLPPDLAHFSGSPMERPNWSDPILPSPGDPVHPPYAVGPEVTIIPTAGVSTPYSNAYGARQYMSFMSIRSWDTPGRWTTNYSGVAYSDDNGQTWTIAPTSIRSAAAGRATVPFVAGNQNFQQGAFVKPAAGTPEAAQGWVYSYGTPSGRAGTLYVSRVQQDQILDVARYEYWNGSSWVANNPSAATPILPGQTTSFFGFFRTTRYPAVSEMSVQYNPYLQKYVMLYGDSSNRIVMRTADSPQGGWSAPKTLVGSWTLWGKYAPYIHPWSGTDNLSAAEQQYLYWNLSTWGNYQVRLMRTDLTRV